MSRRVSLIALLLAAPALAGPPVPAYADAPDYAALSCGLVSSTDPTGAVEQDVSIRNGVLAGGPVTSVDVIDDGSPGQAHLSAVRITVRCWVQHDDATADAAHWSAARADSFYLRAVEGSGTSVGATAGRVRYQVPEGSRIYTCTWLRFEHAESSYDVFDDADSFRTGSQCAAATTVSSGGGGSTTISPPRLIERG